MHPALIIAAFTAFLAVLYIEDCWSRARYLKRVTAPDTVSPRDAHNQRAEKLLRRVQFERLQDPMCPVLRRAEARVRASFI